MTDRKHAIEASPNFAARYALAEQIGAGGFARVFRGVQHSTGQSVAIKILDPRVELGGRPTEIHVARFRREMELCAGLHHPNLVRLIDGGSAEGDLLYTVFDFVPGRSLDRVLADEGALDVEEASHLMAQVLDAIGYAHKRGIIHRDLKPANIMISEDGLRRNALVLDFGIGTIVAELRDREMKRLTASNEAIGTPSYCAPEQLRGEESTAKTDLYSWGMILLECLTGEPPVRGSSLEELLENQLGPDPVEVPDAVRAMPIHRVVARAIAKHPEERAESAQELMEILQDVTPPLFARTWKRQREAHDERLRLRQLTAISVRAEWPREFKDLETERACILAFQEAVGSAVRRHGGTPVASLGSRVVALFGYPQAREQAARSALETAVAARAALGKATELDPPPTFFAGVRSGHLLLPEGDDPSARGSPSTTAILDGAMELEARSGDNEIWACDETRQLLRARALLEPASLEPGSASSDRNARRATPAFRLVAGGDDLHLTGISTTPMVGRDDELEALVNAWRKVQEGAPHAILVAGEAGIGKSRLIRELRSRVGTARWIECRCTPEGENSPLQPVLEWLTILTRDNPLDELLRGLDLDVAALHPLLAEVIGLPFHPDHPPSTLPPKRKRDLTLDAIRALVFAAARQEPLVLAVEDLHWADPTTQELVLSMVKEVRSAAIFESAPNLPLLIILSARPRFEPPWSLSDVSILQLSRLTRPQAEDLARALVRGGASIPESAISPLVERADGVPFFLEEMARMVGESDALREGGVTGPDFADDIPATLRDLLSARIARLRDEVQTTAQTAACIGREFDFPLLDAVSDRDEGLLRDDLEALSREGLIYPRASQGGTERYVFNHFLLSDAARESMRVAERKAVNLRIAETLSTPAFEDIAARQPERLAFHFEQAGVIERAIEFRQRAALRAVGRSAHPEAIHHCERALDLLLGLPESRERDYAELPLRLATGSAYMTTEGYAAEPVEQSFERALELCNRYSEAPRLFSTINGLWGYNLVRGDPEKTPSLVARQREIAERSGSERRLLFARHAEGTTAFLSGRFAEALPLLVDATERFEKASENEPARPGFTPWYRQASTSPTYLGWCLHLMGRPTQALASSERGLELAEQLHDVDARVEAMTYLVALHHDRREPEPALALLDHIVPLCEKYGLGFWRGVGKAARGWARSQLGASEDGLAEIHEGLEIFYQSGAMVPLVYRACYLAETLLLARRSREGIETIDSALERAGDRFDRFFDAEALRLRGELMLLDEASAPRAEAEIRKAVALAAEQGAQFLELRAATSLSRVLVANGRLPEARSALAPVYARFEEGFELLDLADAKALLDQLGLEATDA